MLAADQVLPLLKQTWNAWLEDKASRLAAALAYYTVFSLAPLLVLAVIGLSTFMDKGEAKAKIQSQVEQLMGPTGRDAATQMLTQADQQKKGPALVFSVVILLIAASGVFGELQDSMNTIWEVRPKPGGGVWGWIRTRFLSLAMVFGIVFLLLVSLVASTVLSAFADRIFGGWKVVAFGVNVIVSLAVTAALFAAIFRFLPDAKIAWKDVWLGAALTAVMFELGKWGLTIYLKYGSTASAFGAAGSLAAVLIWVYYSAQILFFGAEFTQVYANAYGSKIIPSSHAEPITAEARRQQGLEPKPTAPIGAAAGGGQRRPQPQFAHGDRRVVTIEQPAVMNRQGYLLAAGGVAAGLIVGAAGVFTGRKYGEPRLNAIRINERIAAIEARIGQKQRVMKRYGEELAIAERLAKIENTVTEATSRLRKQALKNEWYNRIKSYVS